MVKLYVCDFGRRDSFRCATAEIDHHNLLLASFR
jgi:hypothetical protein